MQKKIAIVTGASQGVGKEISIYLSKLNYFVILIARNDKNLAVVKEEIIKCGGSADFFSFDVSDYSQVKSCINTIVEKHGYIDLLVNNAAILKRGTTEISDEDIDNQIKINLNGAIYIAKYVALKMKDQLNGYIINISSLGGKVAASWSGVYAASKFGLSGFSEGLSKEMSLYNVKVTSICPSMIATEMAKGRKFQLDQMIQLEDMTKTLDYLLSLSKNAIPTEIVISCMPLIAKTTEMMQELYLK